ncbi:MAG: chloride channel protein [Acidimicrobiales bacterium]
MNGDPQGEEQANVTPRLDELSFRFWVLLVLTGIAAGIGAIVMMGILRTVQHVALGYHSGEYSTAASHRSDLRLVVVLAVGGLITGLGLWIMRNHGGTGGEPTHVVWSRTGKLSLVRTLISGALSEVTVAMGASLGREAAPQHAGAASGDALARRFGLPPGHRRLLIACGAGAGLAAVYNVPLAGALFTLEIYLGSIKVSTALPALASASIATAVGWIALPARAVYELPTLPSPTLSLMIFAVVIGPVLGVVSAGYVKAIAWASNRQPTGRRLLVAPFLVFTVLGVAAIRYPLLLGNGVDLAQFAFVGSAGLVTLAILSVLKPLATVSCLRSGAYGGLFTPTLSFGAIVGTFTGHLWITAWPGSPMTSYVVVVTAGVLAAAIEAPVTGAAFLLELTHTTTAVLVPILIAVVGATLVARRLDLRSVYTARSETGSTPRP